MSWLGGVLASIPYALGVLLMSLGKAFERTPATHDEDNTASNTKIKRIEDADPWLAPPIFWY